MKYTFSLFFISLTLLYVPATAQLQLINTIAGTGTAGYSGDGSSATGAELYAPLDVVLDNNGNIFIEDHSNLRIRKINAAGEIYTYAGTGSGGFTADGTLATSANISPNGLAIDKAGNIYVSDASYSVVRKISVSGIITTVAGTGSGIHGYSGDSALATLATLNLPAGLAVDTLGNLYIADAGNNVIRMVDTNGIITTIAGNDTAGYTGDDTLATLAELDSPYAVAVDNHGNIYISDNGNNVIRKIDSNKIITTYAGVYNNYGYSGDSSAARAALLNSPRGLATDTSGNLFIADANNNVVRKIDTGGVISTVAGNGSAGFGGDLGTVNGAIFHNPYGIAVDNQGSLYIADANNERIRKTYNPLLSIHNIATSSKIGVYPNPCLDVISISGLNVSDKAAIYDMTGRQVSQTFTAYAETQSCAIQSLTSGIYLLRVWDKAGNKKTQIKLVKE